MNGLKSFFILFALAELMACAPSSSGAHRIAALHAGSSKSASSASEGTVGHDQLKPIFAICAHCHPEKSRPDWLDYNQAKVLALSGRLKQRLIDEKSMPPPGTPEAASITDAQRELVASWIRAGAPETSSAAAPTLHIASVEAQAITNGPPVVQQCFACHNSDGMGQASQPKIPRLAGLQKEYIQAQLTAFKWKTRLDPSNTMNDMALPLSDDEIAAAADYFSGLPAFSLATQPVAPSEKQKIGWEAGRNQAESVCVACHMRPEQKVPAGMLLAPPLFGQKHDYLFNELVLLRSQTRKNAVMSAIAGTLKDEDIINLSLYFSTAK